MAKKEKKVRQPGEFAPWMVPAWSSRALSIAVNVMLIMQITYYCTDALGMSAGLVGMLLLVSKLFDGVTDLMAGVIIDKTNTKWGKARPYEWCIVGVWLCTILLFSTPVGWSMTAKAIYIFVMYTLVNSFFATMLNASDAVYLGRVVTTTDGQAKLMSFNGPIIMLFSMILGIILPILIAKYGTVDGGWTIISLYFAIPFMFIGLGRFFFLKELDLSATGDKQESTSVKEMLTTLKTNKYIFIFGLAVLLCALVNGIASAINIYYFQYIYGNIAAAGALAVFTIFPTFLLFFFPSLMKKFTLTQIAIAALGFGVIGNLIKLIDPTSMPILIASTIIGGLATLPVTMLINIFLIECMDYGEWKNGTRVEGVYAAIGGFTNKLGSGLSSALVGLVMQFAGYSAAAETQSDAAISSILHLATTIPAALLLIVIFIMTRYDLSKQLPQIREELAARRV